VVNKSVDNYVMNSTVQVSYGTTTTTTVTTTTTTTTTTATTVTTTTTIFLLRLFGSIGLLNSR
jgi:hypothetical protein